MDEDFLKRVETSKQSIDWWREQGIQAAFEAEEINYRWEIGELTDDELLEKTKDLDNKILYLMAKGGFENRNLFETFAKVYNENERKP